MTDSGDRSATADSDEDAHAHLRATDLAPLLDRYGVLTVEPASDPFRRLVTSVVNQQLSSASAAAVRERLFDALDHDVTPERVLAAEETALRDAGLSAAKVRYVRAVGEAYRDGRLDPAGFAGVDDDDVIERVTAVDGVGPWTAKMYLLFGLGRADVFPVEDLGVRGAMAARFGMDRDDRAAMRSRAEPWRPYRSYAALYLWHDYEDGDTQVADGD